MRFSALIRTGPSTRHLRFRRHQQRRRIRAPMRNNYEERTGSAVSSTSTNLLREVHG